MTSEDPTRYAWRKPRNLPGLLLDLVRYSGGEAPSQIKALAIYAAPLLVVSLIVHYGILNLEPNLSNLLQLKQLDDKVKILLLSAATVLYVLSYCILTLSISCLFLKHFEDYSHTEEQALPLQQLLLNKLPNYLINFLIVGVFYLLADYCLHLPSKLPFFDPFVDPQSDAIVLWILLRLPIFAAMPFVLYFGMGALILSVRNNCGATDAMQQLYRISTGNLRDIWIQGWVLLLIAWFGYDVLNLRVRFIAFNLPFEQSIYTILFTIKSTLSLYLLVFLQSGVAHIIGSLEYHRQETKTIAEQTPGENAGEDTELDTDAVNTQKHTPVPPPEGAYENILTDCPACGGIKAYRLSEANQNARCICKNCGHRWAE